MLKTDENAWVYQYCITDAPAYTLLPLRWTYYHNNSLDGKQSLLRKFSKNHCNLKYKIKNIYYDFVKNLNNYNNKHYALFDDYFIILLCK